MRTASLAFCLLLWTSCGAPHAKVSAAEEAAVLDVDDATPVVAAEPESAADEGGLPPRVACYFGELMVTRPGKTETNQGALLVKLTLDPARSRMVEDTWSFPLYERYTVTRDIHGNEFTQRQDDGTFTGAGALQGEPWIWRGWSSTTTSADNATRVESETVFEDGVLVTNERVLDAGGAVRVKLRHALDEIPLDECDNMFARARTNAAEIRAASAAN